MNKSKNKLVPVLRFPEFVDDGEWKETSLGSITKVISNRNKKNKDLPVYSINNKEGFLPQSEQFEGINSKHRGYDISLYKIIKKNTFAYNPARINIGSIGYSGNLEDIIISSLYVCFNTKEEIDDYFLNYFFKSTEFLKRVNRNTEGGIRNYLFYKSFSKINVSISSIAEQQKIAACLLSLDDLITAHKDKLTALTEHKKGLMQNLFPQQGQKVPNYRFKEFMNDEEWIIEPFGNVYDLLVTNSFSRAKLNYGSGEVKNIHYGDIHKKYSVWFDITKEEVPFINSDVLIERIDEENYCIEGDIIFADASEDLSDIGKSMEIININKEKLLAGLHTLQARQINNKLEIGFGGYLFKSGNNRNQIKREAQGAKVLGISKTRLSEIKLNYPKNKLEQKKITACLSTLDNMINAHQDKINQLDLHKKGFLQGLFPKV
jgi:type I restriction enzyme S subunit